MKVTIQLDIEVASESEATQVKEALNFMADKFKAKGIVKLKDIYENKTSTRILVNNALGIK